MVFKNTMKIAICVNGRPHEGGVSTFINTVVDSLRELGHMVDVITIFGISKYREVKPDLVKKSDAFLEGSNFRTYVAYKVSQLILLLHLYTSYLKTKYDVIYAIDVSAANIALIIKKLHNTRLILRVCSTVVKDLLCQGKITDESFVGEFLKKQEFKAYSRADGVIPCSTWSRDYVLSVSPKAKVLSIVPCPINRDMFSYGRRNNVDLRKKLQVQSDDFLILFPSRLARRKGPMVALFALELLLNKESKFRLLYLGKGPEDKNIREYVEEKKLHDFVRMTGVIPHREIGRYYAISDVVVVPSVAYKNYEEPLSNVPLEAMAAGVPVVASNIGGLKDSVKHKQNGLLVEQDNANELAKAIRLIREDGDLREELIANGLKTIKQNNESVKIARKLIHLFNAP